MWTFQYELLLKKAWRARWFGKNGQLLVSCQNKEELTLIDNQLYVFSIEFDRGNLYLSHLNLFLHLVVEIKRND
jgi:hypothetical protein